MVSCRKATERTLTPRQQAFVRAWLENGGNGTKAALVAYGCSTPNCAASCASRALRNAKIQAAIREALPAETLNADAVAKAIAKGMAATKHVKGVGELPDHGTRLRSASVVLRLMGVLDCSQR